MFNVPLMLVSLLAMKPLVKLLFSYRETGALCAMKEVELLPDDPKSTECIKQLQQEIKVLSQLKHPNIVQYYGSEIVDARFYIYLEYVHPGSINKYVREHCGAITESVVRNFTRHILSGLAYLHSTKTIHRDIKGANLLVDSSGIVKLADFGMAKHITGQADLSLRGSPYWMAPELMQAVMQRDSSSDLALAVDIWSLGCTIIEMFTGKPPWSEFEGAAAMFKVMKDTPPIPERLSSEGKEFLRCCFRRNPAERPSAAMLLEHRFLKNSQQLDVPSCNPAFNGKNLTDKPHSPRERYENKRDQLPRFPSTQIAKVKLASDIETGQQSYHETSDLTVASRYSPRSTLEALSSLSPTHSGHNRHHPIPYASAPSNVNHGAKKE
jgi:serine/threonine protein kinase